MTHIKAVDYAAGKALFESNDKLVVVDINERDVIEVADDLNAITASAWLKVSTDFEHPAVWSELAEAAVTQLDVQETEIAPIERRFKIPNSVKVEAQQALDWTTQFERGTSAIGQKFAIKLLTDTYATASDVARMDRYFNRTTRHALNSGWNPGQQGYPTDERIRFAMRGGEAAKAWVSRITTKHGVTAGGQDNDKPHTYSEDADLPESCIECGHQESAPLHSSIVASAFDYDGSCEYFGRGINPDTTEVDALLVLQPDGSWAIRENNDWTPTDAPNEDEIIIMLDEESAYKLADIIDDAAPDNPDILPFELASLNPHETALAAIAEDDEDWEMVQRVFDIYDSQERSVNAKKQGRASGGRFGSTPDSVGNENAGAAKARLPQPLPLIPDVAARIAEYLEANGAAAPVPEAAPVAEKPVQASATTLDLNSDYINSIIDTYSGTTIEFVGEEQPARAAPAQPAAEQAAPRPLYMAIVDKVDTEAVLDVVSLMPGNPPVMWKRDAGAWVQAPDILAALQGTQPPPVVELTDDAILADVLLQVDESTGGAEDAEEAEPAPGTTTQAPDGSSGANPDANPDQHPVAAASTRDSFPMWGPHGELLNLAELAEGGLDRNRGGAEELRKYWTRGKGGLKIRWNTPGDMTRCMRYLSKYLKGREAGYCALRHREMTGRWPSERDSEGNL